MKLALMLSLLALIEILLNRWPDGDADDVLVCVYEFEEKRVPQSCVHIHRIVSASSVLQHKMMMMAVVSIESKQICKLFKCFLELKKKILTGKHSGQSGLKKTMPIDDK